ncbi:hypothetical protein BSKO_02662 [Bryopsis sp. KO-2023]|nr:hypothetical protein BSKO_02662 [Bryopsis sp. KO-2023]
MELLGFDITPLRFFPGLSLARWTYADLGREWTKKILKLPGELKIEKQVENRLRFLLEDRLQGYATKLGASAILPGILLSRQAQVSSSSSIQTPEDLRSTAIKENKVIAVLSDGIVVIYPNFPGAFSVHLKHEKKKSTLEKEVNSPGYKLRVEKNRKPRELYNTLFGWDVRVEREYNQIFKTEPNPSSIGDGDGDLPQASLYFQPVCNKAPDQRADVPPAPREDSFVDMRAELGMAGEGEGPACLMSPSRALGLIGKLEARSHGLRRVENGAWVSELDVETGIEADDGIEDIMLQELKLTKDERIAARMSLGLSNFKGWLNAFSFQQGGRQFGKGNHGIENMECIYHEFNDRRALVRSVTPGP